MKGSVLTVGGPPGSGKSTAGRKLADLLHREYVSAGEIFRSEASRRGVDLRTFGEMALRDDRIDKTLDETMVGLASPHRILEGRIIGELLVRRFIPVIRIYITAAEFTRAQRIGRREGVPADLVLPAMRVREASEAARYRKYYGIELNELHYEVGIDSTRLDARQVVQTIYERLPEDVRLAEPAPA
ncbi:MAG: AAA family ATPase [Euryarchaeota archaeon]|nr:AAA family ATPase [Euryarchaeota archaeon]MDE1835711.1 AAA family ATPase [Euryarchaeota archaeon]MDE1880865.1 AAA family ATPase [Euryarchaeota archaeon]MDE2043901.1 AAA family ATPase [Thermoplasmata archaeon]